MLMKKLLNTLIVIIILFIFIHYVNAQWLPIVNPSNKTLHSVQFISATTGFACGDTSVILQTTNAGVLWANINGGIAANINMTDIYFVDINTGYCTGGIGSLSGKIYKTTNSGLNWVQQFDTTGIGLRAVFFINASTGWAAGSNGVVKYTNNGGASWSSRNINISTLTDIRAVSPDTVYAAGFGSAGAIAKSTNGGINWSFTSVPNDIADCRFVIFANTNTGYTGGLALGGLGAIAKTTDRGATWLRLNSYTGSVPQEAAFINSQLVYAVRTDDTVSVTTNGGANWFNQLAVAGGFDRSISINSGFGCIVGRNIAVNTTVGIQTLSGEVPGGHKLSQNYPNPFNPITFIDFDLPENEFVTLKVYNILGKESAVIVNSAYSRGKYRVTFNASELSSGLYFYRLETDSYSETKKMLMIK